MQRWLAGAPGGAAAAVALVLAIAAWAADVFAFVPLSGRSPAAGAPAGCGAEAEAYAVAAGRPGRDLGLASLPRQRASPAGPGGSDEAPRHTGCAR